MNLEIMDCIDKQYLKTPFYGRRKMTHWLRAKGYTVNPKRSTTTDAFNGH